MESVFDESGSRKPISTSEHSIWRISRSNRGARVCVVRIEYRLRKPKNDPGTLLRVLIFSGFECVVNTAFARSTIMLCIDAISYYEFDCVISRRREWFIRGLNAKRNTQYSETWMLWPGEQYYYHNTGTSSLFVVHCDSVIYRVSPIGHHTLYIYIRIIYDIVLEIAGRLSSAWVRYSRFRCGLSRARQYDRYPRPRTRRYI